MSNSKPQSLNHMVTKGESQFVSNNREGHTQWFVQLSNGEVCYQDDNRPDCPDISAWRRLRNYCQTFSLTIEGMWLRFRTETIAVPAHKDGYYFCNSVLSWLNSDKTFHYFVCGYVENGVIYTKKYKIPELIVEDEDVRSISVEDECLILRHDWKAGKEIE